MTLRSCEMVFHEQLYNYLYLLLVVCVCLQGDCANCIHAVIKYNATDACFTLHDINSVLGVYVNDCRVHNSAVLLEHNDIIRFGYTGIAYEFLLECQPKVLHIGLRQNNINNNNNDDMWQWGT